MSDIVTSAATFFALGVFAGGSAWAVAFAWVAVRDALNIVMGD